jgi:hypothetical protein
MRSPRRLTCRARALGNRGAPRPLTQLRRRGVRFSVLLSAARMGGGLGSLQELDVTHAVAPIRVIAVAVIAILGGHTHTITTAFEAA